MSAREDILWSIQRQSRSLQEVLADARQVWRDSNARAAEQRFLQPRAEAEGTVITSVGAQHQGLGSATVEVQRADEQHRIAADQSFEVGQRSDHSARSAQAALSEASSATDQALQADQLASSAQNYIHSANAAGA